MFYNVPMNNSSEARTEIVKYYNGFDYLKVFFILCIVAWHSNIFGNTTKFLHELNPNMPLLSDIIYMNIFMLGVPVFIQISLFLYLKNRKRKSNYYRERFKLLLSTYIFWAFAHMLYESTGVYGIQVHFTNIMETLITLVSGRSIFYFFFSLLVCVSILELSLQIEEKYNCSWKYWLAISIMLMGIFICSPYYFSSHGLKYLYWKPMNFFPYISGAIIISIVADRSMNKKFFIIGGFMIYLLLSCCEWIYSYKILWETYSGHILPPYTRLSLVVGTYTIVLLMSDTNIKSNRYINYVAKYSLGIYCFHPFSPLIMSEYFISHGVSSGLAKFIDRIVFALIGTYLFRRIMR